MGVVVEEGVVKEVVVVEVVAVAVEEEEVVVYLALALELPASPLVLGCSPSPPAWTPAHLPAWLQAVPK